MAATRLLFSLALVQRLGHRETGRREHGASVDAGIQRQRAWIRGAGSGLGRVAARGPRGGSGDGVWPTRRATQRQRRRRRRWWRWPSRSMPTGSCGAAAGGGAE
ncbi:Os09g0315551 [Oryza sativa Japonica Group]|uniref:Os09g0315551 protein n=1 Tax=Oryza sativa subsp. japonica TaxID=39947 RepID=A0A0P0XM49_ORYSJ|nr:Os09g0315551 [Oryza sativa Japonica Group]